LLKARIDEKNHEMVSICLLFRKEEQTEEGFKNLRLFCRSIKKGRIEKLFPRNSFETSAPPRADIPEL
jgi:hypothetical protein